MTINSEQTWVGLQHYIYNIVLWKIHFQEGLSNGEAKLVNGHSTEDKDDEKHVQETHVSLTS